jgi:hypothetical protein
MGWRLFRPGGGGGSGEANNASNIGAGEGVFAQKNGVDLEFKSLLEGANVTISADSDEITIASADPGEDNTGSSLGSGAEVFKQKSGVDLQFRSLIDGIGASVTENTNDISIHGFNFVQSTQPSDPSTDGLTWLRTSDYTEWVWDNTNGRWLGRQLLHVDCTGPQTYLGAGIQDVFAYQHENQMDATGKSWRPNYDILVVAVSINGFEVSASNHSFLIIVNGAEAYELFFDGVNKYMLDNSVDLEIVALDRVAFKWGFSASAPAGTQRNRAVVHYRLRLPGGVT